MKLERWWYTQRHSALCSRMWIIRKVWRKAPSGVDVEFWCRRAAAFALLLSAACSGSGSRIATGTIRDPATGCAESTVSYELSSPYGDAGSLEIPREWCGVMDGGLVCFLEKNNDSAFSGVQLARELGHRPVSADDPALGCWVEELAVWDRDWDREAYHPVWDNE